MSGQELVRRYGQGQRDFSGVRLEARADLVGIDLRHADLSSSDLSGACLARARLDGACFRSADLQNAQLYDASLRHADLRQAELEGANLLLAVLDGADLTRARVSDATLAAAGSLAEARLPDGRVYDRDIQARLQEASLRRARLSLDDDLPAGGA
jgi:uncharacterized protein YjbI with pentapeptide repeats